MQAGANEPVPDAGVNGPCINHFFKEKSVLKLKNVRMKPKLIGRVGGAVAKLSDIREGERIRGEVRIEKKGGVKTQIVLKIHVERAKPVESTG